MKAVSLILGATIIILLMGAIIGAINDFRMADFSEDHIVTTAANVTTATVTLSQDLFGDNTVNALVSSNVTADAPIANAYTAATNALAIIGLDDGVTHRLTIDYKIDGLWDYPGAGLAAKMWPLFLVLGVIGIIVGAVYTATKRGE